MSPITAQAITIQVDETHSVSGLVQAPENSRVCFILAHGAGAGMTHPFLEMTAKGLAERDVASVRYQFPYMEKKSKRPDSPKLAHATVQAAVLAAAQLLPNHVLVAGGKSFGGRMTSQAQSVSRLQGVRGLVFLGFPLHPPGKPSEERATHLFEVQIPMLFLQGTRDDFARLDLLKNVIERLGGRATLKLFDGADHSFRVCGRKGPDVMIELLDFLAHWISRMV